MKQEGLVTLDHFGCIDIVDGELLAAVTGGWIGETGARITANLRCVDGSSNAYCSASHGTAFETTYVEINGICRSSTVVIDPG